MSKQLKLKLKNKNSQTKIIFGFVLLFLSIFLLISFNSFWTNWKVDDDKIISGLDATNAKNILGWIGAFTSYNVIKNLGLNAYGIIIIFFALSVKLIFNLKFSYYHFFQKVTMIILWCLVFLGMLNLKN